MGKKTLFISPENIFTAFSLNNINIIMEQLVEDIDDALMDIDVEIENTSTNVDLEDLGTIRVQLQQGIKQEIFSTNFLST